MLPRSPWSSRSRSVVSFSADWRSWRPEENFPDDVETAPRRATSEGEAPKSVGVATYPESDMPQPIAYLSFDGKCAEAFRFYEKALKGKIEIMMRTGESPMADQMPKESHDGILHAALLLEGNGHLYGGDSPTGMPYEGIKGVSL